MNNSILFWGFSSKSVFSQYSLTSTSTCSSSIQSSRSTGVSSGLGVAEKYLFAGNSYHGCIGTFILGFGEILPPRNGIHVGSTGITGTGV